MSEKEQIFADENMCLLMIDLELYENVLGDGAKGIRVTTRNRHRVWRMSNNVKILNIP